MRVILFCNILREITIVHSLFNQYMCSSMQTGKPLFISFKIARYFFLSIDLSKTAVILYSFPLIHSGCDTDQNDGFKIKTVLKRCTEVGILIFYQ